MCRDIKLENALLDKTKRLLKLTDFGYAKRDQDSLCRSQVGTPNYAGGPLPLPLLGESDHTKSCFARDLHSSSQAPAAA